MILRKPYAFFIKHFKMLHVVLTLLIGYLLYRTGLLLNFFNEYLKTNQTVVSGEYLSSLFNVYMFAVAFLVMVFSIIVLAVMYMKKKPYIFYIINIIVVALLLVFYNVVYGVIGDMEVSMVDIRTVKAVRDVLLFVIAAQGFSVIITLIRATGFDITKFDFRKDLEELAITSEDNEEFELDLNFNTDKTKRSLRRTLRHMRYYYIEHRFFLNMGILLSISFICFLVYMNMGIYNRTNKQGIAFAASDFTMKINKTYITTKDYKGNTVKKGKAFVILNVDVRSNNVIEKVWNMGRTELLIGNYKFYHTTIYQNEFSDMGVIYRDEKVNNLFTNYILVYEIPETLMYREDMIFRYVDPIDKSGLKLRPQYIKNALNEVVVDKITVDKVLHPLDSILSLKDSILGKVGIRISNVEKSPIFEIPYQSCINKTECYDLVEYITPSLDTNYDKILLKINGTVTWDENSRLKPMTDLYKFISKFGTLHYTLNDKTYQVKTKIKEAKPNYSTQKDIYYLEVPKEILEGTDLKIVFHIRNRDYGYSLESVKS